MCRSCHKTLDLSHNPEYLDWLKTEGATNARRHLDQEVMHEVGKRLGALTAERWKNDQDYGERMRIQMRENIKIAHAATAAMDPEMVSAARAKAARVANAVLVECECGKICARAPMGMHLKASGHNLRSAT